MTFTAEQRKWLDELGHIVGQVPADEVPTESASDASDGSNGIGDAVGFPTIPGIDIDVKVESIVSTITIQNDSKATLRLVNGSQKLDRPRLSRFDPGPKVEVPPGAERAFKVISGSAAGINISRPGNTSGEVSYKVLGSEPEVILLMKWHRGWPIAKRDVGQRVTPDDGRFSVEAIDQKDDNFTFIVSGVGGSTDPKNVPTDPTDVPTEPSEPTDPKGDDVVPAVDLQSSCLITVTNTTPHALTLADNGHERGDFMTLVPTSVAPGGTVTFASVETPASPDSGCKGFVVWEVGSPMVATWRIEWDNPEGEKNTTNATVTPQTSGLRSTDQIGQGEENVPVAFTLSGGSAPGHDTDDDTDDKPDDDDKVDPAPPPCGGFEPPVESKQPTLRRGDKSQDQWVEYAQNMLSYHLGIDLAVDGDFGKATEAAVIKFQKRKGLAVDGILGNQTWAALREASPDSPSTDGREPHSYVETGAEARWALESGDNNAWLEDDDVYSIVVVAVGDTPLDPATEATLRVTAPGAAPAVVKLQLGSSAPVNDGLMHLLQIKKFRATFPSAPVDAPITGYRVEAYLPQELGGDYFAASVQSAMAAAK